MPDNADITPPADPWVLFREWYARAEKDEPEYPDAMALATATKTGMPSVRMVLLRGFENGKLVFFTNRESRKGLELGENPHAAVCLYWRSSDRQVRAEGPVDLLGDRESDAYFAGRPRESQLGAWASLQSQTLADPGILRERMRMLDKKYEGEPVLRPPHWGGYQLTPLRIEFWEEREFRLHGRIVYHRPNATRAWVTERLYP